MFQTLAKAPDIGFNCCWDARFILFVDFATIYHLPDLPWIKANIDFCSKDIAMVAMSLTYLIEINSPRNATITLALHHAISSPPANTSILWYILR